jgi:hypothetical protein
MADTAAGHCVALRIPAAGRSFSTTGRMGVQVKVHKSQAHLGNRRGILEITHCGELVMDMLAIQHGLFYVCTAACRACCFLDN